MKSAKRHYDMTARAAKAAATRERIRESAVALYCQGPLADFTLEEVARRAGATVQTVLRAFGSKDNLIEAALRELAEAGVPLRPTPPGEIAPAVDAICDLYETIGDALIQRLADENRRPALKPVVEEGRRHHRAWVKGVFAPQLERERGAARTQLFNALVAATDVYVWKLLRRDQGLSRAAAEAVICRMIRGASVREDGNGETPVAQLVGRREPAA